MITNAVTLAQGVTVTQLKGQIYLVAADGSRKLLVEGDVLPKGAVIMSPGGASFMGGGQSFNVQPASEQSEPAEEGNAPLLTQNAVADTPDDINALQQAILAGTDPTQAFAAAAAGGAPAAGGGVAGASGNAGFVTIDRTGTATIAEATFDTTYNANGEPPREAVGEEEVFDLTPPTISVIAPDNTNDTTPTITGKTDAAPGSTVTIVVTDVKGNPQTLTVIVTPEGTFTVDVITPLAEGSYTVTATVTDPAGNTATGTDEGSVNIDDPVVAEDDRYEVNEDGSLTLTLLANDKAPDGGLAIQSIYGVALTGGVQSITVANGTVVIADDGSISFVPGKDFNGDISFDYVATDADGDTDSSMVNITITPVGNASVLAPDLNTVTKDTALVVAADKGLLSNDQDVDNTLTVSKISVNGTDYTVGANGATVEVAGKGTLVVNADGSYSFTPVKDFAGALPMVGYTTNTGLSSTLALTMTPVGDASVLAEDSNTVTEDTALVVAADKGLLSNDQDVDNTLTVSKISVNGTDYTVGANGATVEVAGKGTLVVNADGSYSFTPVKDFAGVLPMVGYTTNTGLSSTLTLTMTPVDDASVLVPDLNTVTEDTALVVAADKGLLSNDQDVDNTLTVSKISVNGTDYTVGTNGATVVLADKGTLVVNADGSYSFTPVKDFAGALPMVGYTTNTGLSSTLTLTMTPVEDASTLSIDSGAVVSEEGLAGGIADKTDNGDTTNNANAVASGRLVVGDVDSNQVNVTLAGPSGLTSGGSPITWAMSGQTLVGSANGQPVIEVRLTPPNATGKGEWGYQVTLKGPVDHSTTGPEDTRSFDLDVRVSDGQSVTTGKLPITIEDDAPQLNNGLNQSSVKQQITNLLVTLDISDSMNRGELSGRTRLSMAQEAITNMLVAYEKSGDTLVKLTTFTYDITDNPWGTVNQALWLVHSLQATGGTNYADAIKSVIQHGAPIIGSSAKNVSYFISDGQPHSDYEVDKELQQQWTDFVNRNQINSMAFGIGAHANGYRQYLEPIAFDGTTKRDQPATIITNTSQLNDVLVGSAPAPVSGNIFDAGGGFGADGGYVNSVTVGGVVYRFDGNIVTSPNAPNGSFGYNPEQKVLVIRTTLGGELSIDLDSGAYWYRPVSGGTDQIALTVVDRDGDSEQVGLTLELHADKLFLQDSNVVVASDTNYNPLEGAFYVTGRDDRHDILLGNNDANRSDVMKGDAGNDRLIAAAGNDELYGGLGNDILVGGEGNDLLIGGAGADKFVWETGDTVASAKTTDYVMDFNASEGDRLDLSDLLDRSGSHDLNTLKGLLSVFEDQQGVHINLKDGSQDIILMNQSFSGITGSSGNTANQVLDYMLQQNLLDLDKS